MKKIDMPHEILIQHKKLWIKYNGKQKLLKLKEKYQNHSDINAKISEFIDYLYQNNEKIILGSPMELYRIKQLICKEHSMIFNYFISPKTVETLEYECSALDSFKKELSNIFNYGYFTTKCVRRWDAYKYLQKLNVAICPYCERNFITTFISSDQDNGGKTRAQLDHFYCQSKYPYFSMSIYNLIPSCYVCNASFKRDIDFDFTTHFHPFENQLKDIGEFSFGSPPLLTEILSLNYSIRITEKHDISEFDKKKIENLKNIFFIEDLYNINKHYFDDFINYHKYYTNEYTNQLDEILSHFREQDENLTSSILDEYRNHIDEIKNKQIHTDTLFAQAISELNTYVMRDDLYI